MTYRYNGAHEHNVPVFEYEKYSAISHNINGKDIIMYNKMRQTEIITTFMYPLKLLFSSKLGVNHSYHKKRVRGEQFGMINWWIL